MNIIPPPPPPPLYTFQPPTTTTTLTTNGGVNASPSNPHHHSSSTSSAPTSSAIIIMIVISSAIILSATVYLLLRYLSRRCNHFRTTSSPTDDVVSTNQTNHVLPVTTNTTPNSLPLFTFASLTGKITGGDCAVCLSKFAGADLLRLLPLCCHAFHVDCIDVWLRSNHTCPLCRSTVNPTDEDILNTLSSNENRNNSFRIEIGSFRRNPSSMSDRRSYSVGSYDYVLDDGYEIPVESTHRSGVVSDCGSVDKDSAAPAESAVAEVAAGGGSGRRNWLRDYVDRFSTSLSSHSRSLRGSGRFFAGNSRRSEGVNEFEGSHGRIGEEISELFRWFSGV